MLQAEFFAEGVAINQDGERRLHVTREEAKRLAEEILIQLSGGSRARAAAALAALTQLSVDIEGRASDLNAAIAAAPKLGT